MIKNIFGTSAFFDAYIKEKHVIDVAIIKAAQDSGSKVDVKKAFLVAGLNKEFYNKVA